MIRMASISTSGRTSRRRRRPRCGKFKSRHPRDATEVATVIGDQYESGLAARERQEDVVAEGLRDSVQLQTLSPREFRENRTRRLPRSRGRRDDTTSSCEDAEDVTPQFSAVGRRPSTGKKLLRND